MPSAALSSLNSLSYLFSNCFKMNMLVSVCKRALLYVNDLLSFYLFTCLVAVNLFLTLAVFYSFAFELIACQQ